MTAIGETLRRERLRRGLGLEAASRDLKISVKFLEAIEEEHFDRLPGGVFTKAFIRQYAQFLGLDGDEVAAEVQRQLQPATSDVPQFGDSMRPDSTPIALPKVDQWETVGDRHFQWSSSLTAFALVVAVMMGCAGVYSWWQRGRHTAVSAHEAAPAAAQPAAPPQSTAAATPAAPVPTDQSAATTPTAPPDGAATAEAAKKEDTSPSPAPVVSSVPNPPANPNAPVRVELVATEPVWVLARTDGKYLFSGTIEANQTRTVDANQTVLLRLGNAGGVEITLNGKPLGAVGPKGQVRTVQLTSGGFEIVAAPKPPVSPLDDRLL